MSCSEENSNRNIDSRIRKRYSLVWKFFEKLSSSRVRCRVCKHEQKYLGNTANALRHLKVKHDVDARAVGLSDSANVKRMNAIIDDVDVKQEGILSYDLVDESTSEGVSRPKFESDQDQVPEVDPYADTEHILQEFIDYDKTVDNSRPNMLNKSDVVPKTAGKADASKKATTSLLDERLMAETEYFREKADYYRTQKHLSAIQAKRAKYELDKLLADK